MPIVSEHLQLSTRNTMVYETPHDPSVRQRTEEEDDDMGLSEGENNDNAEMSSECPLHRSMPCSTIASGISTRLGPSIPKSLFWACGVVTPVHTSSSEADSPSIFAEQRRHLFRLSLSFFLFGLINNGE